MLAGSAAAPAGKRLDSGPGDLLYTGETSGEVAEWLKALAC